MESDCQGDQLSAFQLYGYGLIPVQFVFSSADLIQSAVVPTGLMTPAECLLPRRPAALCQLARTCPLVRPAYLHADGAARRRSGCWLGRAEPGAAVTSCAAAAEC